MTDTMLLKPARPRGSGPAASAYRRSAAGAGRDTREGDADLGLTGALSAAQLDYAAGDAAILLPLEAKLTEEIAAAGLEVVAELEMRCLPAIRWMSEAGVPFDVAAWETLLAAARQEAEEIEAELAALAPVKPDGGRWNWRSPAKVKAVLAQLDLPGKAPASRSSRRWIILSLSPSSATCVE